jgi:hypothetical protein
MTRMTLIFVGFILDDPCHPRHPRSIDAFFAANTNCYPDTQLINDLKSNAEKGMAS